LSTWNYLKPLAAAADLATVLDEIRESGFGAELWLDWTAAPQVFERPRWPEIRKLCSGLPALSAHTGLIKYFSLETLCEEMNLCAYLGADPLVCHPRSFGIDVSTWAPKGKRKLTAEDRSRIGVILKQACDRSLRVALENGPLNVLTQVLEVMADHPAFDHLGICIDTGHAHMHSKLYESPTLEYIRSFRDHLVHLHLHDNRGLEDEHLVPGLGTIDWPVIFAELAGYKYNGQFVFELATGDPQDSAERARNYIRDQLRTASSR
jgi:sugar phosphate isomerase/epimerase